MILTRMHTWLRAFAVTAAIAGFLIAAFSGLVSYWSATGTIPPAMYGLVNRFTSLIRISDVPVEFLACSWFLAAAVGGWFARRAYSGDAVFATIAVSAVPVSAYAWRLAANPVMVWPTVALAASGTIVLLASLAATAMPLGRYPAAVGTTVRTAFSNPRTRLAVLAWIMATVLGAQGVRATVHSVPPEVAGEHAFSAWFKAQSRLPELDGFQRGQINVVIFTDYECPSCQSRVPVSEMAIETLAASLSVPITVEVRDFPLEPECNPFVGGTLHPSACEAAAAVLFVTRRLGSFEGREMGLSFYRSRQSFSREVVLAELKKRGLESDFAAEYTDLVGQIRRSSGEAAAIGVRSTPTVFVNGVKLRSATHLQRAVSREAARFSSRAGD